MAEQHITPSSHSALTRESNGSSPSRVVGGRWLRQVRQANRSRRNRRNVTSPLPRHTNRHSSRAAAADTDAEPRRHVELRRSSRLVNALPRSDYSISERWSYGADFYETRYDTDYRSGDSWKYTSSTNAKRGRNSSSHDRKKHKRRPVTTSSAVAEDCVAYCTRSRTALKLNESACEPSPNTLKPQTLPRLAVNHNATATSAPECPLNSSEGGLLPLDERDYAYSPFSSSTITELLDSDYSVYSPTAHRRKGKKRKRSTHRSLSTRKSSCLVDIEDCKKKFKIDPYKEVEEASEDAISDCRQEYDSERPESAAASHSSCTYLLRNRHRDLGPPTATVISDNSASTSTNEAAHNQTVIERKNIDFRGRTVTPPPYKDLQEASSSKAPASESKLLIVPRDLPYLRQTNARRSIAAATGANLGACLTRGAGNSQRQRQEAASKRQVSGTEEAGSSASGGRRARARDMPQPQPASTRRDKRGKTSLGSCASAGGASSRSHPQPLTTGAVASTSSSPPVSTSAVAMPDNASNDAKQKAASSSGEECNSGGAGGVGSANAGGAVASGGGEESSSEEGEVGRLQALLEARGLPPHLLGALGPRMQHLLHRTVTANSAASKAAQLLAGLQATGDEGQQLQAVIEMCQLLVMGNEDTLAGFPVRQVVPALVNLLAAEHNFDMMNHACRALTYMLEALPRSSVAVALAVPAFLDKLQAITCMDVAEQSLTALDMLSRRHSKAILQARGVSACLTYLDFFSINAQRAALSITANCCQNLTPDEFHLVRDSLQLLANRLTQQDKKSVECVCMAFSRLVDSFQNDPARLQEIATPELLTNLQQLLVVQPALISGSTFITVLRLLWVMCAACPQLALALHQRSIADTLLCLLTGSAAHHEQVELVPRLPQELYEITCLIGELMPRLPTDGIFAVDAHLDRPWSGGVDRTAHWQWRDDRGVWRSYSWAESRALEAGVSGGEEEVCLTTLGRSYTVDLTAMQQLNDHTGTARPVQRVAPAPPATDAAAAAAAPDPRIAMVRCNPSLVRALLAVLHEVYWSSAGPAVRSQALKAILRCVYYADAPLLRQVLKMQVISSHIAGMMASSDLRIVVGSLQLGEILMQRLPEEMGAQFRREGVLHQVSQLAQPSHPAQPTQPAPQAHTPRHHKIKSPSGTSARSGGGASPPASTSLTAIEHNLSLAFSASGSFVTSSLPTGNESSEPGPTTSASTYPHTSPTVHRSGSPLQLAEMLRRKRAVRRSGGAPARGPRRREDLTPPHQPPAAPAAPAARAPPHAHAHQPHQAHAASAIPSASRSTSRVGGASRTSSFLSSLNPSRWGRTPHAHRDTALLASPHASTNLTVQNKEKVREWIVWKAGRLQREWGALDGGAGALEQLAALAGALPHAHQRRAALHQLRDTLLHHDVSPFEVNHSGVLGALLQYLTGSEAEGQAEGGERDAETEARDAAQEIADCEERLRLFLHVFADMPLVPDDRDWMEQVSEVGVASGGGGAGALAALVGKVNACVSHLEQFPVRVHDLPARPATSALRFFNTHQLMCDLKRHPNCTNLKQWKGGVVRIDPLALVQAIERYLAQRGYASTRPRDGTAAAAHSDDEAASDDDVEDSLGTPPHHQPTDSEHKLEFLIGDTVLPYNMTVYQAVRQFGDHTDADTDTETPIANAGIWVQTHTIYYRAVEAGEAPRTDAAASRKGKGHTTKISSRRKPDLLWNEGIVPARESPLFVILRSPLVSGGEVKDASLPALGLLRALHALARHWHTLYRAACLPDHRPLVPNSDFINPKLAAKANRQLQDPLVIMTGNLPPWLKKIAYACPFVLPFECRHLLFYVVSFDRDRALQRLLEAGGERGAAAADERVAPRLDRRKRTVQRHSVLRQAEHVMHEFAHTKALLEIQYENEVGTGLGPTLEFYALVSQELQRADLDLWHGSENFKQKPTSFGGEIVKSQPPVVTDRSSDAATRLASSVRDALSLDEDRSPQPSDLEKETSIPSPAPDATYVNWPCGLFPQAIGRNARASHLSRVKAKFRFLGKFMAKAVMDSRMVDIPLSVSMYRWLVSEQRWLGLSDVRHVAPELWRSLCRLRRVAERAQAIAADSRHTQDQRAHLINALELDGCPIEELGLDFILPGDGCTELRRGGRDLPVTAHNLHNYIGLVTHWLLYEGVAKQMEAFKEGFESVFPLANLKIFYPEELEQVFCGSPSGGREQRWEARMLAECIRPDHGYTAESRAIRMLVDILASYSRDEQRLFLQFVTGSPRLPTGGFKALNPPLTVVRKSLESSLDPDEYLPSVMTCVNYLKLPDYSSAEVMRAKLRLAASEGQHSFHLS
ncbi:PREDICTED: E3 ubiquitin-protein ligase TRIP12 isoform X1 [Papilio xuthus]|uniref:E3 ubiquitin-protein ligase n=1 Tax=Papilio xuthus TaxID=66420 RepID=A0AAJ6Z778_PAPXU|nr:PREDICTED: E3 ubiquitin-protein ligase TRIP12 isoform X1 [Papilio xuthus]XP_013166657.1 PREDICTED: E3 ubiquitin-protein ligase TRIP12 isoform X1 [Papilio xuthus]XP_013166658.1 PREDICTED: E3 ubiquitin-protein ligase TRIP12 isoform X1 [Papilio xuthus]XP_013166660.1 PREDICTED: E3 ubiquitin-protein ligase TRIP12 isoform X1 [Papilio xuthus]